VAGEEVNTCSVEQETELTVLAGFVRVLISTVQSYQLPASLNNISADKTEATGTKNKRECEPEIVVVSCMLVLSHF
jgi:hypothetical protein